MVRHFSILGLCIFSNFWGLCLPMFLLVPNLCYNYCRQGYTTEQSRDQSFRNFVGMIICSHFYRCNSTQWPKWFLKKSVATLRSNYLSNYHRLKSKISEKKITLKLTGHTDLQILVHFWQKDILTLYIWTWERTIDSFRWCYKKTNWH